SRFLGTCFIVISHASVCDSSIPTLKRWNRTRDLSGEKWGLTCPQFYIDRSRNGTDQSERERLCRGPCGRLNGVSRGKTDPGTCRYIGRAVRGCLPMIVHPNRSILGVGP